MTGCNIDTVAEDSPTQERDPIAAAAPYGVGLATPLLSILYKHAVGHNAINSSLLKTVFLSEHHQLFPMRTIKHITG